MASATVSSVVVIERILSHDPTRGGAIFSGPNEMDELVRVVAPYHSLSWSPKEGDAVSLEGLLEIDVRYGKQLKATRCEPTIPRGRLLIRYLALSKVFPGVGRVLAEKLYGVFGEHLPEILSKGDVDRLMFVVNRKIADRLVAGWRQGGEEAELMAFLDRFGLDARLARKIRHCWGSHAMAMLETNPYCMLAFAGWGVVDSAGLRLGVGAEDSRRLIGAVESALYARLNYGHTLASHSAVARRACELLRRELGDEAISAALAEGVISGAPAAGYQLSGVRLLEERIAGWIRKRSSDEQPLVPGLDNEKVVSLILESEQRAGLALNEAQRQTIVMALRYSFTLMLGGAGVGKTTTLRTLIDVIEALGGKVVLLALAGRAAKQMADTTQRPAFTIARFLLSLTTGQATVEPGTLLIIDEASMIDVPTFYRLLRHLPDDVRLMLVGDPGQLPPIGFGLILHRLVDVPSIPKTELTRIYRQAAASGIPEVAATIKRHETPNLEPFTGEAHGVSFLKCHRYEIVPALLDVVTCWDDQEWQIVGSVKNGAAGIHDINTAFHSRFSKGRTRLKNHSFAVGDPVLFRRNDYDRMLMNGSLGRVVAIVSQKREEFLQISFDGEMHEFGIADLSDIELAYAITCHKAQGSQFKRVAIPVTLSRILDHSLIYTALTRGVEQVVLVGDFEAFKTAVREPSNASRRDAPLI